MTPFYGLERRCQPVLCGAQKYFRGLPSEQLGVVVGVGGGAAAQDVQGLVAGIVDAVGGARGDDDAVADGDGKRLVAQDQAALAAGDVVDLLAAPVAMQAGAGADGDHRLRQALVVHRVPVGMQEFADFRTVLGEVGGDRIPGAASAHWPPQGWMGTVEMALAGAPSMILRLMAR